MKAKLVKESLNEIKTSLAKKAMTQARDWSDQDSFRDPIRSNKGKIQANKFQRYVNPKLTKFLDDTGFKMMGTKNGVALFDYGHNVTIDITSDGYKFRDGASIFNSIPQNIQRKISRAIDNIQTDLK